LFPRVSSSDCTWSKCENTEHSDCSLFLIVGCLSEKKCIGKTRSGMPTVDRAATEYQIIKAHFPALFSSDTDGMCRYNNNYRRNFPCGMIANIGQTEIRRPRTTCPCANQYNIYYYYFIIRERECLPISSVVFNNICLYMIIICTEPTI